MKFQLVSDFKPTGDQPQAIKQLTENLEQHAKNQVLLGVTGSGKTFTIANVIQNLQRPALIISHNKTLAGQLYQEFRDFFPHNAVSYFVSYYDYYQPEAYIPHSDTYIEKEVEINEEIDKLRLSATTNLLTRKDVIVVASVSCIYNLGSPIEYGKFVMELLSGMKIDQKTILLRLADLQYERYDYGFKRGSFRIRGESIDLFPAYSDFGLRMEIQNGKLMQLANFDPLTGDTIEVINGTVIYPAKHYMTDPTSYDSVFKQIRKDLELRVKQLQDAGKMLEAQRIKQRTEYDLEMIREVGFVNGIENYSRYFDGRKPGEPPFSLLDYFEHNDKNWLLFIDESHMTIPQIRGMYNGDRARKEMLIEYGFRLPSALDNRPLRFDEFMARTHQITYVSATPNDYEISLATESANSSLSFWKASTLPESVTSSNARTKTDSGQAGMTNAKTESINTVVEQLIRPTGLVDPKIEVRKSEGQIPDLMKEIEIRTKKGQRVLVTTLTKRMAEELSSFLEEKQIKVSYLHSDIETLDRQDVLDKLRLGNYDVLVGINLLREGLDLPEVSLVVILDADKEGFLRSRSALIQTMGRAARNVDSQVIMYADNTTKSMQAAIEEVERRRKVQLAYNKKHGITPKGIQKVVRARLVEIENEKEKSKNEILELAEKEVILPDEKAKLIKVLRSEMRQAAKDLDFEMAANLRDRIRQIEAR